MPQTSRLGEPSTPLPRSTASRVAVVVPEARAGERFWALTDLIGWLDARLPSGVTAVCWQSGPMVASIRAARVIDAGAVNDQLAPRALAALHLRPPAQALKSVGLRRRLRSIADCDHLLLGAASTLPLLEWLPPRPTRRVALWWGDDELERVDEVVAVADAILVAGDAAAQALTDRGVDPARWQRVAEPLVAVPRPVDATTAAPCRVVVVGAATAVARAAPTVLSAAAGAGGPPVGWLHLDARSRDLRWTDARFAGLEGQMIDLVIDDAPPLAEMAALVMAGPVPGWPEDDAPSPDEFGRLGDSPARLAARAALAGVPVIGLEPPVGVGVVDDQPDPAPLHDHLVRILADPAAHAAATADVIERAQPHRIDLAQLAVLDALGLPAQP